jgi:DNA-binding helix-hairpin-helix protein with protein kinase domain
VKVFGADGKAVELGAVLGRGGEGAVYARVGDDTQACKIYTKPPTDVRAAKLTWMVAHLQQHPDLAQWCTWPQELLFDEAQHCVGFAMERLWQLWPIHEVYQPEQRKAVLPLAGWDFLVHVAANCARMFETLHKYDVIVGDVNERNIFVSADAMVHLVDCDSFQIRDGDRFFGTGVGVVDYTPPELQGKDFRLVARTVEHDRFGLAVIAFKLLMMGRHPFSGGPTGDLHQAILNKDWDYPQLAQRLRHLLPWSVIAPPVRAAFASAFTDEQRPAAGLWVERLAAFEASLQPCRREPLHKVPDGVAACPWCTIEQVAGYAYFAPPQTQWQSKWQPPESLLAPLDEELRSLPAPRQPEEWQAPPGMEAAIATARAMLQAERPPDLLSWYLALGGGLVAIAGVAMALFRPLRGLLVASTGVLALAVSRWLQARRRVPWHRVTVSIEKKIAEMREFEAEWKGEALRFRDQDRRLRGWLAELREQVLAIGGQRQREIDKLAGDHVSEGLRAGLTRFDLATATIPAVPVERRRALGIRGVLTAADLDRAKLAAIPGLAATQIDALIAWRRTMEAQLTGTRSNAPTTAQLAAIDANFQQMRDNLLAEIRGALGTLRDAGHLADSRMAELVEQGRRAGLALQARVEEVRRAYIEH